VETEWVLLQEVGSEAEAEMIKALLESQGIPVILTSTLTRTVFLGLSAIHILVPGENLAEARELVSTQ